ncbi:MAG TPA: hypothetical protein VGA56_14775 [Opitutaceae bacterium]
MNTTIRPLVYGAAFFALLAYLGYAISTHGIASNAALNGFSLLTAYGLIAIAIVSYAPAPKSHVRTRVVPAVGGQVTVAPRVPMATIRSARAGARLGRTGVLTA